MKKGDKVRLISSSIHDDETQNWLEKEERRPRVGDVFTISRVHSDGWIGLEGISFSHPPGKFELVTDKTNTMKDFTEYVFFHTPTPELSTAVQLRLFELGYLWTHEEEQRVENTEWEVIGINYGGEVGYITYSSGGYKYEIENSADNEGDLSLLFYSDRYKTQKKITIAGYTVQIQDDSIKVGCTEVSKEELEALLERLQSIDWFKK